MTEQRESKKRPSWLKSPGRRPTLSDFADSGRVFLEAAEFVAHACGLALPEARELVDEAAMAQQKLLRDGIGRQYPRAYSMGRRSVLALYAIVRWQKPEVMLETGVADGISTAMTLAAMESNGMGRLHSVDIDDDVGGFVSKRDRWQLHIVGDETRPDLRGVVTELGTLDIFMHDSAHHYEQQMFEYEVAWPSVRPGGLLLSDDVNWSFAFLDFAGSKRSAPATLRDGLHRFGAIGRSGEAD